MSEKAVYLRRYAEGDPQPGLFSVDPVEVRPPGEGEVLVEAIYFSCDPFVRMQLNADAKFPPALPLDQPLIGRGVARVVESRSEAFRPGDYLAGEIGWRTRNTLPAQGLQPVDPSLGPISAAVGLLGSSGLTGLFTLTGRGGLQDGETVLVSAAAGAVGTVACQVARSRGCHVIAIGGGPEQLAYLRETVGVDAAIDWKAGNLAADLREAAPDGVDLFLDTVGGQTMDAGIGVMKVHGRIVSAGFISGYGAGSSAPPCTQMGGIVFKRLDLRGFLLADFDDRRDDGLRTLGAMLREGRLTLIEHIYEGIETAPEAFCSLFGDAPPGKKLVRVNPDPTRS